MLENPSKAPGSIEILPKIFGCLETTARLTEIVEWSEPLGSQT
jgi:hypothetical protein